MTSPKPSARRSPPTRWADPGLLPGIYFRLPLIGYFEGLDSERGIAWRAGRFVRVDWRKAHEAQEWHSLGSMAIGSALKTWLAAHPHVTRQDVQAALEMGSTLRQWLRDRPQ
jgi:hypothetical protein